MSRSVNKLKSFQFKLTFNFYLATILIIIAAVFVYNYFFQNELNLHVGNEITSITKITAALIDPEDFKQLKTQADEGTEQYRHIRKTLQDIKRVNPEILYIYTLRPTSNKNTYEFVVDADKKPYHIGDKYDVSGQLTIREAVKKPVLEEDYENNQWGTYLTGYAPIKNTAGETVGIVGIDYEIGSQKDPMQLKIMSAAFIVLLFGLGITTFFVFRRNAPLIRPFKQITAGITQVSEGNLGYRINVRTGDEWEQIAGLVNNLAEKMALEHVKTKESLEIAEEQKDKVLKVYSDVISSATYGRFKLIEHTQAKRLSLEGVLYSEAQLGNNIDKEINLAHKMFAEKELSKEKSEMASRCISTAIENVLKHAGSGFIQFRVLDGTVRIIIADSGKGIDWGKLPDILFVNQEMILPEQRGIRYLMDSADVTYMATSSEGTVLILDFAA